MSGEIVVRAATAGDLPGLRNVAIKTWRATYHGQIPDEDIERFLEANYSLEQLERIRERVSGTERSDGTLVALMNGEVVGYAMTGPNREGVAEVFAIYALPEHQGKGVGYRLWERIKAYFRGLGHDRIILWVLEDNQRARAFYERQGGRAAGERPYSVGATVISEICYEFSLEPSP